MKRGELFKVTLFYFLLTLLFFYKIFFNLIPLPTDIIVGGYFPWINYEKVSGVGIPVKNPKLSDAVSIFYPLKSLAADMIKKGEFPLWNPHMFGGYPLFTNPTLGLFFPTNIFYLLFSTPLAWSLQTMLQPLLASIFMYVFLRHIKLSKTPSLFGGFIYGFGGFTLLWLQWNGQATSSLLLPILLFFEDKYISTHKQKWGLLLAVFTALLIFSGYLPVVVMTLLCMLAWYVYFSENLRGNMKIVLFILLGVGLSAFFLLPLGELIMNSQRTVETLGSGSPFIHPQNLVTLIAPDFFGNDATYNFWGKGDHMDSTLYVGIATVVLAVYALIKTYKNKYVRFSIILTVTAALLAFRNPVSSLVYQTGLWGGSSITMNRINFIFNFCLAVLASFGVSLIEKKTAKSVLKYALSLLTLLLFLIAGLFVYKLTLGVPLDPVALLKFADTGSNSLIHTNIALRNLAWPTLLSAGVVFTVWFFKKLPRFKHFFIPALMVVLIVDLFRFGWKFNTFSSKKYIYPDTPISEFLKQYPNDRFAAENDIFPANMWVPFGLSTISGYDSIYPYRSAKLLAVANSGNVDATPQPRWGILSNFSSELIDISNVRFLVTLKRDKQGKIDENGNVANNNLPDKFIPVYEDRGIVVMENKNSLPRAYMTNKVIKTPDAETISLLINEGVESGKIAYSNDFGLSTNNDLPLEYSAEYRQVTNSHVVVTTSANQDAFLVVSDSYYPGWQVFVDGNKSSIHRANYNYRGVFLKEGEHFVEFIFFPDSLKYGIVISAISLVTTLFITFKKGKKITPGP